MSLHHPLDFSGEGFIVHQFARDRNVHQVGAINAESELSRQQREAVQSIVGAGEIVRVELLKPVGAFPLENGDEAQRPAAPAAGGWHGHVVEHSARWIVAVHAELRLLTDLWAVRACWICGSFGVCQHREPEVDLAILGHAGQVPLLGYGVPGN